jgi:hypothetical protein
MTVDEFAEMLLDPGLEFVAEGHYVNRDGRTGYRAVYKHPQTYYWYSVSGAEAAIEPDEVAQAVMHPSRTVLRENTYFNRSGKHGFEATVSSAEHWFMLNAAPDPPRL